MHSSPFKYGIPTPGNKALDLSGHQPTPVEGTPRAEVIPTDPEAEAILEALKRKISNQGESNE